MVVELVLTLAYNSLIYAPSLPFIADSVWIDACLLRIILEDATEIIEGPSHFLNTVFANVGVNLSRFTALMTKKRLNVSQARTWFKQVRSIRVPQPMQCDRLFNTAGLNCLLKYTLNTALTIGHARDLTLKQPNFWTIDPIVVPEHGENFGSQGHHSISTPLCQAYF